MSKRPTIYIEQFPEDHPLTMQGDFFRTDCGHFCWNNRYPSGVSEISYAKRQYVAAFAAFTQSGEIAGIFRYFRDDYENGAAVVAQGTFVWPKYRKLGIGRLLWDAMLQWERPKTVEVTVVSDRGLTLVETMRARYPQIKWDICEDGSRKLRKLGGKSA